MSTTTPGIIGGLLGGALGPKCPNDPAHGPMEQYQGHWSIDQVQQNPVTGWIKTNTFIPAFLYRCNTCKVLQFYDND